MQHAFDLTSLPKSTPKAARTMLAEAVSELADLRAQLAQRSTNDADRAIAATGEHTVYSDIFDRVNRRSNQYGSIFKCRIAENCQRLNVAIAAKALGETLSSRHSTVRKDRNGRKWIDFYPAVSTKSEDILGTEQPAAPPAPPAPQQSSVEFDAENFPF